jgi:hypothetical protein
VIDLDSCIDKVFEILDITDEGKSTLDLGLESSSEQGKSGFVIDAKDVGNALEFSGELRGGAGLLERS